MKVLVACEFSGAVRDAFAARGHDAWSCDMLPSETAGQHYQGDARDFLDAGWDLLICHPPCTHLAVSGARWFKDKKDEQFKQDCDVVNAMLRREAIMQGKPNKQFTLDEVIFLCRR